ncbi:MAG: hypothetical protein ACXVWW_07390 [Nocardioides sp.]
MRATGGAVGRWLTRAALPLLLVAAATGALVHGYSLPVARPALGAVALLGVPTYVLAVWTFRAM